MTKSLLVLGMSSAMILAGVLMWKAEATPLAGATNSLAVIKSYSAVQKAGCMFGTQPLPCRHQMVLHQNCGSDGPLQGVHLPALLAAGSATTELLDNLI